MSEHEIIDVIGEDAAIALAEHFGGTRLYIPAEMQAGRNVMTVLEVIGEDACLALAERFGGNSLYVPKQLGDDHDIAITIGIASATALVEHFGGRTVYVGSNHRDGRHIIAAIGIDAACKLRDRYGGICIRVPLLREQRVRRYREAGMSAAKIATRLCMTENGVEKALKRLRDQGQLKPAELCRT